LTGHNVTFFDDPPPSSPRRAPFLPALSVKTLDESRISRQAGAMRGMFSPATVVTAIETQKIGAPRSKSRHSDSEISKARDAVAMNCECQVIRSVIVALAKPTPPISLKPGTRLVREWRGVTHPPEPYRW
jgi:hypothetical protein